MDPEVDANIGPQGSDQGMSDPPAPKSAPPLFSEQTYNILLALIIPLLLTLTVLGFAGRAMCQDYALQMGPHSATGAFLGQVCGAPGNGNLIPGIQSSALTVIPSATADMHHVNNLNNAIASELNSQMQDARMMFNQTRNLFAGAMGDVYSVMMNIVIQLVRMGLKTKDIAGRLGGATAAIANATQGAQLAGESILNGPIVGVMKVLCFTPSTPVEMDDGTTKPMQEVKLGDVLRGGSVVTGVMQFENVTKGPMHALPKCSARVSGSHLVQGPDGRFIRVDKHPDVQVTDDVPEVVHSLTTSDHLIRLGEQVFWDYDD
jgi:hypothetical protein